ncbi:unnamed protein product [Meganyctiphanes norvegica]|uniref:Large ribosomal subunit protein mL46 n=1 Tax=Meganyctiphanes norvegica TaxID=48144 RepID=A0AAV2R4H0_MEGNR
MVIKTMQTTRLITQILLRNSSKLNSIRYQGTAANSSKWQILGAVCVTRPPVVCPPMDPMELKYSQMLSAIEQENSYKSQHEIRHEEDLIRAELLKIGDTDDVDLDEVTKQTAVEFVDAANDELKRFSFTSSTTDVDVSGDLSSLNRALERSLCLVVKQKLGEDHRWVLPQGAWNPGETLRQTCERVVKESCGSNMRIRILSNAPCGFYKYKYPKQIRQEGYCGAKVFFYRGQIVNKDTELNYSSDITDHAWLTQDELDSRLQKSYAESVAQFLISDK